MDSTQAREHIERLDAVAEHRSVPFSDQGNIRWRIFGRGDPLLLVHGGHGSWLHWIRNIEVLAREHCLLVPDLPGCGDSDDQPAGADLRVVIDALIVSLDRLLGERSAVDVAAFSLGGIVSSHLAALRGGVRRLALLGTPGTGTPRRSRAQMIRWRYADEAAQNAALKHNLLAHMMYDEANVDGLAFEAYASAVKATRFRTRGVGSRYSLASLLAGRTEPILFCYGAHDVTGTPELAREALVGSASNRELHVIPSAGHWVQFERADEVNDLLAGWFGGNQGKKGCAQDTAVRTEA